MGRSATLASSCVCVCVWQWWFLNLWSGSHGRPPGRLAALEAGGPAYYYSLKPPKVRLLQHVSEWSCLLYFDSSCGCSCLSLSLSLSVCIHSHSVSAFWLTNGWVPYLASLISGSRPAGGSLDQHEIFFFPWFFCGFGRALCLCGYRCELCCCCWGWARMVLWCPPRSQRIRAAGSFCATRRPCITPVLTVCRSYCFFAAPLPVGCRFPAWIRCCTLCRRLPLPETCVDCGVVVAMVLCFDAQG